MSDWDERIMMVCLVILVVLLLVAVAMMGLVTLHEIGWI